MNQHTNDASIKIENNNITLRHPGLIRFLAHLISYIFHPLFIPAYVAWYILFIHPAFFDGISSSSRMFIFRSVVLNMVFFPGVIVLLSKAVGFINSIFLRSQRDRIIPYIAAGVFFFWMYLVFKNQPAIAPILTSFIFGVFLSSSAALLCNIYFKISMHAIGCGGLLGIIFLVLSSSPYAAIVPCMIAILITGLVCTSRMIISDHTPRDIYLGLILGWICQHIAAYMIM